MFLRKVVRRSARGTIEYLYLVEGYRDQGRVRQRVVANLGRADLLAPHAAQLVRLLRPYLSEPLGPVRDTTTLAALTYGPPAVARRLWDSLGVHTVVAHHCGEEVAERAWVLVAHRLLHPGSEHALAWWLEESYVTDAQGRRWRAQWDQRGRVRVRHGQLQRWYRTLDRLLAAKAAIEQDLYLQLRDLFGLQVDLVFFDITSTYFAGRGPESARYGHSRDGHARDRQVLVGVVMASGWPIASYVFAGNRADRSTVAEVLSDVRARFPLQRVVWVADRGMVSEDTLRLMTQGDDRYLVGLQRRRNPLAQAVLQAASGQWEAVREGGHVQEVHLPGDAARYIVVRSPERLSWERERRREAMRRCRDALRQLAHAVTQGRLRAPEKIGARAGAILKQHHGHRYFTWALTPDGHFRFWVDRAKLRAELRVEGTYILQTNDTALDTLQAVAAYKDLQTVERGFRCLKDVLAVRPIYHQTEPRVRGHLFVAHLALLLGIALEKALRRAGLALALDTALEALRPVRLVTLELDGHQTRVITKPTPYAQAILKAVGLPRLTPPEPCSEIA
jgi:transposase